MAQGMAYEQQGIDKHWWICIANRREGIKSYSAQEGINSQGDIIDVYDPTNIYLYTNICDRNNNYVCIYMHIDNEKTWTDTTDNKEKHMLC